MKSPRTAARTVCYAWWTTILLIALVTSAAASAQLIVDDAVDTFAVRRGRSEAAASDAPASVLRSSAITPESCTAVRCTVSVRDETQRVVLRDLESRGRILLEPLPDAHRLFFQHATYDFGAASFDRAFSGVDEVAAPGSNGLFAISFKSYPEPAWLKELGAEGLRPLESIQTMGYYFYGPKRIADTAAARFPYVHGVLEVPPGLKRVNLDAITPGDDGGPAPTLVVVVTQRRDDALDVMRSASGRDPELAYDAGPLQAYAATLSREDARNLSAFPEVVSIRRGGSGGPSDERANRIIAGTWQTPGTSWPPVTQNPRLPSNTSSPPYWTGFLSQLAGLFASLSTQERTLSLGNQTVAFLDTGIDSGLRRSQQPYCPPYLRSGSGSPCTLVFTTDTTEGFEDPETRADDRSYHGTLVSSLAAGFAGQESPGRDINSPPGVYGNYAFTQGVAQGARVAMCKLWRNRRNTGTPENPRCPTLETYREINDQIFSDESAAGIHRMLNYALVELSRSDVLPDFPPAQQVTGPGARLFNHSWNTRSIDYDADAVLLDQTTRLLSRASFTFDGGVNRTGAGAPGLHIVSAGNIGQYYPPAAPPPPPLTEWPSPSQVTAPATAKNVITVGATESYNQEGYNPNCGDASLVYADNPRQVYWNSRIGFPNQRLKPDIVAPATASYGRTSAEWNACPAGCSLDLDGTDQYGWSIGTSFAAPVAAGAAAIASEWLRVWSDQPSPALVKASLIATAQTLTRLQRCGVGCTPCCDECGDMRPAPDKYQGWGGLTLDRLLRPATNYFFFDQGRVLRSVDPTWTQSLTVVDRLQDVNIALVWTDRHGTEPNAALVNLVNDLDLEVSYVAGGQTHRYQGNAYYTSIDSCARDGYSLLNPAMPFDHKNNVERINIRGGSLPMGVSSITVTVSAFSLTGDGIFPGDSADFRQDFALAVENARQ